MKATSCQMSIGFRISGNVAASTEKSRVRNDAEMTNELKIDVPFGCHVEFECDRCCFKYFDWRSNICQIICVRMLMLFHLVGVLNRVGLKTLSFYVFDSVICPRKTRRHFSGNRSFS